jgi:aldehyde:ferredoxin oxidoreductase
MYLRNGRIGVFDLASHEASDSELTEDLMGDDISSLVIADKLASIHGEDSLVFGTGVLTASFVPAACAGFIRARSYQDGWSRFMPILGFAGVELKLSGFDFIVLKGTSGRPGYLWARDGMIEFVDSEDLRGEDSWTRTDKIRADQGDGKIQVISSGPWGDSKHEGSQLVINYWGGEDKAGLGSVFGEKNLLAVAFRGMGEIELAEPEKHFEDSVLMMREHILKLGQNHGLASYSKVADRDDFRKLVHRQVACYGCPFPCRSFLKTEEDPREMRLAVKDPGYLHYDVPALESAFSSEMDARDATLVLRMCAKAGAEPVAILSSLKANGARVAQETVASALTNPQDLATDNVANFEASFQDEGAYRDCLGLGLCPRYWSKVGFDKESMASFGESAVGKGLDV